jgi:hypothetical protein
MKKLFLIGLMASLSTLACDRGERREAANDVREETREAGEAIERGAEDVAARVPDDDRLDPTTKDHEEYIGTVTRFSPGKSLAIETASGDNQSFDLDETGTALSMPKNLKEGAKVHVTIHRSGNQKTITVASQK